MAAADVDVRHERNRLRVPAVYFIIVYIVLLLCIPSRLIVGPIGSAGTPANLWGLMGLVWWACATLGGQNPRGRSPIRLAAGLLILAVLISYLSAMTHGWYAPANVRQTTDEIFQLVPSTVAEITEKMMSAADRGLLSFASWMGIVLLTADGLRSWRDLEQLVKWLVWCATFVAVLGIVQFFTGLDIASLFQIPGLRANYDFGAVDGRSVLRRVSSTAVHPIEFGVVMAGVFPFALHRAVHQPRSIWSWIPVVLIGVAIPMSVSRSAILTLAVAFIILAIGWPSAWRRRALLIAPLAVIATRLMVPGLVGTIISLFTNFFNDDSITGRTDDYGVFFNLYFDNPILGRGIFTFLPQYYRYLDNQFLMNLIELGAVGLLVVIVFFSVAYFTARGARRRTLSGRNKHLAQAIAASIVGVTLSYATYDAWSYPMATGFNFLLVGLAGAAWQIAVEEGRVDQPGAQPTPPENESLLPSGSAGVLGKHRVVAAK